MDTALADEVVNTQCAACPNQCGYAAYVVDGSIDKVIGNPANPYSGGTLCARGFGSATAASNPDRLTEPMRRNECGAYDAATWDEALTAIAESLVALSPETLAAITDGTSTAHWYMKRFMASLGSANCYVNATTASSSIASGLALACGYDSYEVDYARTKAVLILGASTVEVASPAALELLAEARERGAAVMMADWRQAASASVATEWLPVKAGTELALVLAIAHILLAENLVTDEARAALEGLDEWEAALADCTAEWAADLTGLAAPVIVETARTLAAAAPAACIDLTWMALYGGAFANTGELARATALVNTLLGCWNVPGGAYVAAPVEGWDAALGTVKAVAADATLKGAPLAVAGSAAEALRLARDGAIKGLILVDADVVATYPDPAYVKAAIEACSLSVCIAPEMTDTAWCCDWVLPEKAWTEAVQLPLVAGAVQPTLVASAQVIEPAVEGALSVPEIVEALAGPVGTAPAFGFTVEDAAEAFCKACGSDWASAVALGSTTLPAREVPEAWPTASGKVECASEAAATAGYTAVPVWVAPSVTPAPVGHEYLRLTTGFQAPVNARVLDEEPLAAIARQYELDGVWVNADVAADLGLAEGDEALISNEYGSATLPVHVTQALEPTALYLASGYGSDNTERAGASGLGARQGAFGPYALELGYGAPLTQEMVVTIGKAGA